MTKLKVMFSTHGLVEGDFAYATDEKGYSTNNVISKKVITGQDTGGQVYYVKALAVAGMTSEYDIDLVTRRVDPRICPQFGGQARDLGSDINYDVEVQWHEPDVAMGKDAKFTQSRVLRVPAGGNFNFVPKEEIVPLLPEIIKNTVAFYEKEDRLKDIAVVEGHYRDGMLAANMMAEVIEEKCGYRPVVLVTSHSLGHKKYERNKPKYDNKTISEEEWRWHNFAQRIEHEISAFNGADIIVATSPDEQVRLLRDPYQVKGDKITIIPPGYNSMVFKPLEAEDKARLRQNFTYRGLDQQEHTIDLSNKKVVSSLGRVVIDKGFVELSKTMNEIIRKDRHIIFMVSGENNNPVTAECRKALKGLEENVIFLPSLNQSEMAKVYNVSTVFVMSSLNEAFGMVPIEAMGCKTAVVVGRSGFNDYAHCADIRDDKLDYSQAIGIYAPSQDEDRWRQLKAINKLLNNDELQTQIAENGYEFVSRNLTWQKIAEQKDKLVAEEMKRSGHGMTKWHSVACSSNDNRLVLSQKVSGRR